MNNKIKLVYKPTNAGTLRPVSIDLYMSAELDKVVRTLAGQEKMTINQFICETLRERIEQDNGGRPISAIARSIPDVSVPRRKPNFRAAPLSEELTDKDTAERTLEAFPLPAVSDGNPGKIDSLTGDGVSRLVKITK